jgi:EAL domain-containing protein (putative c-di-GMP-specific phosphodiesterase class I)
MPTLDFGKSLDLEVSAEGVETQEQRVALSRLGCRFYQGYLFGRPEPAGEMRKRRPGSR